MGGERSKLCKLLVYGPRSGKKCRFSCLLERSGSYSEKQSFVKILLGNKQVRILNLGFYQISICFWAFYLVFWKR